MHGDEVSLGMSLEGIIWLTIIVGGLLVWGLVSLWNMTGLSGEWGMLVFWVRRVGNRSCRPYRVDDRSNCCSNLYPLRDPRRKTTLALGRYRRRGLGVPLMDVPILAALIRQHPLLRMAWKFATAPATASRRRNVSRRRTVAEAQPQCRADGRS
jgi:hypothetical protein